MAKLKSKISSIHNCEIQRSGNVINITGYFSTANMSYLLAKIHNATEKAAFSEIVLNFSDCTGVQPAAMLAICPQIIAKRKSGINVRLELPETTKIQKLFLNANWAYLIDPRRYDPGNKNIYTTHIPATNYLTPSDQHDILNKIINVILGAIPDMKRSDLSAFEWSINEITDNVLTHSESSNGGLVQLSILKQKKVVQYMVADSGIGIPRSMRSGNYPELNDVDALDYAIREGVTRDNSLGQGNGLFGSYQVTHQCGGNFQLRSGNANLYYSQKDGIHISNETIPYDGTLVIASLDFSNPGLLSNALKFGGTSYTPGFDFIEQEYETGENGELIFRIINEADSFGTRVAGTPVRRKIKNLMDMYPKKVIKIYFDGVPLLSSSFADEVFGKLFQEAGPLNFMQCLKFENISEISQNLIDKAITQRMQSND